MEKVSFAVVGCGHIGKRHAEVIVRNNECQLTALVDVRSPASLGLETFEVPVYEDMNDLLASDIAPSIDVITIATPNGLHAKQALIALDAGKHVVIEKPIALTFADAESVMLKALMVGKQVFVVMQNRYSRPSIWLKEMIAAGRLGKVFIMQFNCYWNRDARYYTGESWHGKKALDGGSLFTQFSHFVDMMYWLFGDIKDIKARLTSFNHRGLTGFEDSGLVNFQFVNGGMGCINFSTSVWDKNLESSITVIAEHGSVKISGQYMDAVEVCHVRDYVMEEFPITAAGSAGNHQFVIQNVVDVLKGRAAIATSASEGAKVVEIIERIYLCAE